MAYDFSSLEKGLQAAHEWLIREYAGVRTGRATPAILDSIMVSAYGSMMPIKQVANVSVEDARTLRVVPWDMSVAKDVERAISTADLGVGVLSDSSGLRVTFPQLTGERRTELVKIAKGKLEEARTAVRVARDECWKKIQEDERDGSMSEDEKFSNKDAMQKKVDAANDGLEKLFTTKEAEMQS